MFVHHGFRALWPVLFFLPWLLFGIGCLFASMSQRRSRVLTSPITGTRRRGGLATASWRVVGLALLLSVAPLALAGRTAEERAGCAASSQEQARQLGEVLFEQGAYQRAGQCYQAAGEYALANRAFLKAVAPESAATARQLSDQRDRAKTLLRNAQQAFRSHH